MPGPLQHHQAALDPVAVGLVSGALFALTWSDAVQAADSGELVTAACQLGVAHPPGYPLYTLLGHLACQLPWSSPAGRVAALSVLAGAAAAALVCAIVLRITGSRWAAAVASLTLATGSLFWRHSSLAEVFALNAALCAGILYLALRTAASQGRCGLWWAAALGLGCGLAASHHQSAVLVFPVSAAALLGSAGDWCGAGRRLALAALGFAIGLAPHLHLLLADPDRLPRWGDTAHLPGLVHHVLRRDYGTLSLSAGGAPADASNLVAFLRSVPGQLGWVLWPAALLGLFALALSSTGRRRGAWVVAPLALRRELAAALLLSTLLAGPLFVSRFNIAPQGVGAQVVERFYLLPLTLLAIALGLGLAALEARFLDARTPARRWRRRTWRAASGCILGLSALSAYRHADVRDARAIEDAVIRALEAAEPGALVLGADDVLLFAHLYLQTELGLRRDVQYVDLHMLHYPWYRAQIRRRRPQFPLQRAPGPGTAAALVGAELARGTPVYLANLRAAHLTATFPSYPIGPLIRLLPPGTPVPPPEQVWARNRALLLRRPRRGRPPDPASDPWAAEILAIEARNLGTLAGALARRGNPSAARAALEQMIALAPWLPLPGWLDPAATAAPPP